MDYTHDLESAFQCRYNDIMPPLFDWMAARFQEHYSDWKDRARQDQICMAFASVCVDVFSQVESKHGEAYFVHHHTISEIRDFVIFPYIEQSLKDYTAAFYKDIYRPRSIDATPFETDEECAERIFSKLQPELNKRRLRFETAIFDWERV